MTHSDDEDEDDDASVVESYHSAGSWEGAAVVDKVAGVGDDEALVG
jgi:hypothetical protein